MVRYRPGFYDRPYRRGPDSTTPPIGRGMDSTTPPIGRGMDSMTPPIGRGMDSTTPPIGSVWILRPPPLPPPTSHLLVASLLVVINECPLGVSWAGYLSGLEVGKLGKTAPKARNFF